MGHARPREDRRGPSRTLYKYYCYGGPSACSWVCTRERPWLQACARAPIRVQAMRRGTDAWGKTPEKRVVVVPNFDNFDSAWTTTIPRQITIIQSKSAKNLDIARYRGHETRLLKLPIHVTLDLCLHHLSSGARLWCYWGPAAKKAPPSPAPDALHARFRASPRLRVLLRTLLAPDFRVKASGRTGE